MYITTDKFTFGKCKGYMLSFIIESYPYYIQWCLNNIDSFILSVEASGHFKTHNRKDRYEPEKAHDPSDSMHCEVYGAWGPDGGWGSDFW